MCWTLGRISKAAGSNLNGEDGKEEKEKHYFKKSKISSAFFGHFKIFYKNTQWQVYLRGSQTTWTRQARGKFYLNLSLNISVFPSKKCSGTKKIQTRWNLIKLHPLSSLLYKNCIPLIFPVEEFASDSADASLNIQGKVSKEFLWNPKWNFDQLGQTLVIAQWVHQPLWMGPPPL